MRVKKEPIDPGRLRRIPSEGFSWVDRRFVRDGFLDRLSPEATLLYFFLTAVSDARGLSFYADSTISRKLKLDQEELCRARGELIGAKLILYRHPLYQVLALPARDAPPSRPPFASAARKKRGGEPISIGELLRLAAEKTGTATNETTLKENS